MVKKPLFSYLLLIMIVCLSLGSQAEKRNCSAMDVLEKQLELNPNLAIQMNSIESQTQRFMQNNNQSLQRVDGVITIPVVVHVIYQTNAQNISEAQIQSQMQVLNDDFRRNNSDANNLWSQAADTQIEFCLATVDPNGNSTTGITRKYYNRAEWGTNDAMKSSSNGGVDAWPSGSYLNMWLCNIGGGILGYAQFPGGSAATDGVVMSPQYFGTIGSAQAPFDGGRTTTHEVGHWLNLRHIWGDGNCNADDFVSDTPASDAANYGCASSHVSCSSTDMVQNYMDYSDDSCMNLFTQGQTDRMRALFDTGGFRASLLNSTACGGGSGPVASCNDGIQNQGETGIDCGGPCAACPSNCNGTEVSISITFDNYPEETSWTLTNSSGATVASGGTYASQADGSTLTLVECLSSGCYDFTINDVYGDGICCSYGNGSYSVTGGGSTLVSGGSFTSSATTNFCLGTATPTCSDGIQNQGEAGIDCGGPCTNCATCNDGIQNQGEAGIDCGGPCSACPTASCNTPTGLNVSGLTSTEGTLNWSAISGAVSYDVEIVAGGTAYPFNTTDNFLGITGFTAATTYTFRVMTNCGGASSSWSGYYSFTTTGNNGGGCSTVTVDSENFESGWGIWNDGGSDSYRNNYSNYATSGSYTIRLRDNTSSSVMTTDNLNLTNYEEVTVDFSYYPVGMDNNEDFWLQISTNGGSSYTTVETWVQTIDFNNNTSYSESVTITGDFTSNTKIRFRVDASVNNDRVYFDDITIAGCASNGRGQLAVKPIASNNNSTPKGGLDEIELESYLNFKDVSRLGVEVDDFELYPNPTSDFVQINLQGSSGTISVFNMLGKEIYQQNLSENNSTQTYKINVADWKAGYYLIGLTTNNGDKVFKKLLVN